MARLSAAEKAFYAAQGYVVPAWRLPETRVESMRNALDRLLAANPGVRPERLVSAHLENARKALRAAGTFSTWPAMPN